MPWWWWCCDVVRVIPVRRDAGKHVELVAQKYCKRKHPSQHRHLLMTQLLRRCPPEILMVEPPRQPKDDLPTMPRQRGLAHPPET